MEDLIKIEEDLSDVPEISEKELQNIIKSLEKMDEDIKPNIKVRKKIRIR